MRILFVTPETPAIGGGGIATYIRHAKASFEAAGHEVFTLSWVEEENAQSSDRASAKIRDAERDRIINLPTEDVWRRFPNGPYHVALSYALLPHILAFTEQVRPAVIETTDFNSPMYAYLAERRAGRLPGLEAIPVVGFNHGLTRLLYSTNGVLPTPYMQPDLAAERQAMRWCDVVIVPSQAALRFLVRQVGNLDHAVVVSEPFAWDSQPLRDFHPAPHLYHLGRVAFSKGIDHDIHFLNVLSGIRPIERVIFLGKHDALPFRISDVEDYVRKRTPSSLRDRLHFLGQVNQSDLSELFSAGGYSMNFSRQETFNYAFVEMLAHGLFPYVRAQTAMEEFLPSHLRRLALPEDFDLRGLAQVCDDIDRFGAEYHEQIVAHVQELTSPVSYVEAYEALLSRKKPNLHRSLITSGTAFQGCDVTVLMATFNNPKLIEETVYSIREQTVQPARTVIMDDGSTAADALATLQRLSSRSEIKVIRSLQNEGLCATRVKLLDHADTTLSIFVDSDDVLHPSYIETTLGAMNRSGIAPDAVQTWRQNFGESNELIIHDLMGDHYHVLRNDMRVTSLIKTSVLKDIGFISSMRNGEADDWLFWLQFTRKGYRSVMVGEPLFLYRFATGSMSWPWSEGQAALTGFEIARLLSEEPDRMPQQAMEDLVAERVWHILNQSRGGYMVSGETFGNLFNWALALQKRRPRLFGALQRMARPVVRRLDKRRN